MFLCNAILISKIKLYIKRTDSVCKQRLLAGVVGSSAAFMSQIFTVLLTETINITNNINHCN